MEYQWNKSFEAGLPTDKEIMKNPDDNRTWIVQAAIARVLVEMIAIFETPYAEVYKPAKKK